ncbi:MAG TPA: hypothetical protein VF533_07165 [Solirubrobacteraceae bacterium]|jgi:hypothetical protein
MISRACLAAVVALVAAPAVAQAAQFPAVAVGPAGTAHAAWLQSDGRANLVQERRRAPDGLLTDAQYVSAAGRSASPPRIGSDRNGTAIIAWAASDGSANAILSRRRAPDGTLGPVQRISAAGINAYDPDVAVDPDGNAVYIWQSLDGSSSTVQVRRRTAAGVLGSIQTVSAAGGVSSPRVGLDTAGNAVLAWMRLGADASYAVLQTRSRSAGGTLGPTQTLTDRCEEYDLAVASNGRAAFSWVYPQQFTYAILGRRREASGTLNPIQTISPVGTSSFYPTVAIDPSGRVVFAWERTDRGQIIEGRVRRADGTLGNRFDLDEGYSSRSPEAAVDDDGNATFTWASDSLGDSGVQHIRARRRTAAGALSPLVTISSESSSFNQLPHLGLDANGNAVFVWEEHDGEAASAKIRRRTAGGTLGTVRTLGE